MYILYILQYTLEWSGPKVRPVLKFYADQRSKAPGRNPSQVNYVFRKLSGWTLNVGPIIETYSCVCTHIKHNLTTLSRYSIVNVFCLGNSDQYRLTTMSPVPRKKSWLSMLYRTQDRQRLFIFVQQSKTLDCALRCLVSCKKSNDTIHRERHWNRTRFHPSWSSRPRRRELKFAGPCGGEFDGWLRAPWKRNSWYWKVTGG